MIHPDLAFEIIKKIDWKKDTEKISIEQSLGRILANDITATLDSPPFDKSAMDGFAYHSSDNGKRLKIIGSIAAGENSELKIKKGECIKIMTGAMIPQEADRVVKIENCTVENGFLTFKEENIDNIIKKGENLKTGEIVLKKCKLQPQHIGILASLGIAEVEVAEQPLVGIITTGTELKNPGEKLKPGQIYNSNGFQITAQVEAMNCKAKYYGTVPDDKEKTRQIIFDALSECDVLILSGGVSKGDFDFVPYMLEENGVEICFIALPSNRADQHCSVEKRINLSSDFREIPFPLLLFSRFL
jgi:molybdopterin molybdotransferase